MSELQKKIIEHLKANPGADSLDVAIALKISVDIAYREVDELIGNGTIGREYVGLETRLIVNSTSDDRSNSPANPMTQKAFTELCLVSKHGVCILDIHQVSDKAKQLGMKTLAEICEQDLKENRITTGQYYPLVAALYGVAA